MKSFMMSYIYTYDIMKERERERERERELIFWFSVGGRGFEVGILKTDMSPRAPPQPAAVF